MPVLRDRNVQPPVNIMVDVVSYCEDACHLQIAVPQKNRARRSPPRRASVSSTRRPCASNMSTVMRQLNFDHGSELR